MLESNTDRMYFTIGSIIVAALLIAGAKFIFGDQIFADDGQIMTMFNDIYSSASSLVGGL